MHRKLICSNKNIFFLFKYVKTRNHMFHIFDFRGSKKIVFPLSYKKTRPELQLNRKLAIKDTFGHPITYQ